MRSTSWRSRAARPSGPRNTPAPGASSAPTARYDELLADPDVEAVYIPLPNTMHSEWSIRALEAGKHVLCEKPFSRHIGDVEAAFDAAERTGLHLSEAFMYRHHPQTARLAELRLLGSDRGASCDPYGVQLLAVRRREHPLAHRRRGWGAHGRGVLLHQRCTPPRRRAGVGRRSRAHRLERHGLGVQRLDALSRRRHRAVRLRHVARRIATSSRRSGRRARSSSTTRGTARAR